MSCFGKLRNLFKRGSSAPPMVAGVTTANKKNKNDKKAQSLDNLNQLNSDEIAQPFNTQISGLNELNPESVDSDDEQRIKTARSCRSAQSGGSRSLSTTPRRPPSAFTDNNPNESTTIKDEKLSSKLKSLNEYESSSTSSDQEQDEQKLSVLNSLIPESILRNNESQKLNLTNTTQKSNYSISTSLVANVTNRTVTFEQPLISAIVPPSPPMDDSSSKRSIIESDSEIFKKNQELTKENRMLVEKISRLEKDIYELQNTKKLETDTLVSQLNQKLSQEFKTESDKDVLKGIILSKRQDDYENILASQTNYLKSLEFKCKKLEDELAQVQNYFLNAGSSPIQIKQLTDQIKMLEKINHRITSELSLYQAKYPSKAMKKKLKELSGLPSEGPIPSWTINLKMLSPLIAAYDDRLNEKDEFIRKLQSKLEQLGQRFEELAEENIELHATLEKIPHHLIPKTNSQNANNLGVRLSEWEQIKRHAQLVLEENQVLKEQIQIIHQRFIETQNINITEKGRFSKRIVLLESDKVDLSNRLDTFKMNFEELKVKYNEISGECERRIGLEEHLKQIADLKRKIEDLNVKHKTEMENVLIILQTAQAEKKEAQMKVSELTAENKKYLAENEVLERELYEGIGRKMQKKLLSLSRKLEIIELKETNSHETLEKVKKDLENAKVDRDTYQNLLKSKETELLKQENKRAEECLRMAKLEEQMTTLKEKASLELAKTMHKIQQKEKELNLNKLDNEKRIADILNVLQKKQDQIDDFLQEKRQMEAEIETIWQTASSENRKLKEVLHDLKSSSQTSIINKDRSIYHLLLND